MTTILNGLLGGLVIGLIAGVVTQLGNPAPSVTGALLARTVGNRVTNSRWWRLAVLIVYGGLAGSGLLALELFVLELLAVPPTIGAALGVAIAYSAALFTIWILVWRLGPFGSEDRSFPQELLVFHLVYGFGLGFWIRVTWIT